jgi:hypothetical protein
LVVAIRELVVVEQWWVQPCRTEHRHPWAPA